MQPLRHAHHPLHRVVHFQSLCNTTNKSPQPAAAASLLLHVSLVCRRRRVTTSVRQFFYRCSEPAAPSSSRLACRTRSAAQLQLVAVGTSQCVYMQLALVLLTALPWHDHSVAHAIFVQAPVVGSSTSSQDGLLLPPHKLPSLHTRYCSNCSLL